MTAFWIVLGIMGGIELLLACPVTLIADYEESLCAKVRYLFLTFRLAPPKEQKQKKARKKPKPVPSGEKKPEESKIQQLIRQQGVKGFLHFISQLAEIAAGAAKDIFKKARWKLFSVDLTIVGEDAAQTAVDFGYACSVIYPAAGLLTDFTGCKRYHVSVVPGFMEEKSSVRCKMKVGVAVGSLLAAGFKGVWRYFKMVLNQKKVEKLTQEP